MTSAPTLELHHPLDPLMPATGELLEVAPGVRWLRMPLPFALDHINLWLLRDRSEDGTEGWAVVDCGIANPATQAAWEQVFASGLDGLPVLRVIVTHMHPDHIGLAQWLTQRWGCRLWISATDFHVARIARLNAVGFQGEDTARFYARHGVTDASTLDHVRNRRNEYAHMVPGLPDQFVRLLDGQHLQLGDSRWQCIVGYGHAPEHMALWNAEAGVLISGDMVLPRISTNISVISLEPLADPLTLYLDSLDQIAKRVPADVLVLPSHGRPFTGLHTRIAQLHQHHTDRLAETLHACTQAPLSAAGLMPLMFRRPLDAHQTGFALGESLAHLHTLVARGLVRAQEGADGVVRFAARDRGLKVQQAGQSED